MIFSLLLSFAWEGAEICKSYGTVPKRVQTSKLSLIMQLSKGRHIGHHFVLGKDVSDQITNAINHTLRLDF